MILKKYEKMKYSGIEWIGDIPEHWETPIVGYVYHIQLGKMLQPNPLSNDDVLVPYLKADNVQWEDVKTIDLPEMWADFNEVTKYHVVKGDLLVCEGGEGGRSAILNVSIDKCIIQNAIHRVRSGVNSEIGYLLYLLRACGSSGWLNAISNKATIQHFTRDKFSSLKIPLPPQGEQKLIVDFLDEQTKKIDVLIQKTKIQIEKFEEFRQAIISSIVTGKIDVRQIQTIIQ